MISDRRQFVRLSSAFVSLLGSRLDAEPAAPAAIVEKGATVRVDTRNYAWEWSAESDVFRLFDKQGRLMETGSLQPAVIVKTPGEHATRCSPGKFLSKSIGGSRLAVTYAGVNEAAKVTISWRFEDDHLRFEPVAYETTAAEDIVSLHYFSQAGPTGAEPSLRHSYLVQPGISMSPAISPVVPLVAGLELNSWLGHGSWDVGGIFQQWALPTHYFCGVNSDAKLNEKGALKEHLADAYCCGLAELPAGDLFLHMSGGRCCPVLNVRSDLWGQARGPGRLLLGAAFYWAIGRDYREAIRQYYLGLVREGVIRRKVNSSSKNRIVTMPQFDTWGGEVAVGKSWYDFDEPTLNFIYSGLKKSGMKPGIFVIDAKWEGKYGRLEHSAERFPHFDEFLEQVREDGHKLGMWAAFLRCEDPESLGLNSSHMLRGQDGKPITMKELKRVFYLFDVTQAEVQGVLGDLARRFMKRYDPDLVKFDFGYELPSLSRGAPKDMAWAGERLLKKGLDVVVGAMREVKPELVVMYYSLSPLLIEYFDLSSPDDMFMCAEDYHLEANRRFFFSSLLGEIGMPTYGSGGYDWLSMRDIWFDSAVVGSLGSLNSFAGDEQDSSPTRDLSAKYNGLSQLVRSSNVFTVEPLDPVLLGGSDGARSSSWVRLENGEPVLVALRSCRFDGSRGVGGYKDLVRAETSVVVASKTEEGIAKTAKLAIVPYGEGKVTIRRDQKDGAVTVLTHRPDQPPEKSSLTLQDGLLLVPLREHCEDGSPIEWLEIDFAS